MGYVKITSWHVQSGVTSRWGMIGTRCGRWATQDAPTSDELPGEKSCESCLRLAERDRAKTQ